MKYRFGERECFVDYNSGTIFRHFKGNLYRIICIAIDSEDDREMVVYKALYEENKYYVREASMFFSEVDHLKYPDVEQKYRFEIVKNIEE